MLVVVTCPSHKNHSLGAESLCSKILGEKIGIKSFLDQRGVSVRAGSASKSGPDNSSLKAGFEFLAFVLNKLKQHGLLHGMMSTMRDLAEVCFHIVRNHDAAVVSNAAFEPLQTLFGKFRERGPLLEDAFAKKAMDSMLYDYSSAKTADKASKSGWKQNAFKLMGKICKNFKQVVTENAYTGQRPKNFEPSATQKPPDPLWIAYTKKALSALERQDPTEASFIAGCFDGLVDLLVSFSDEALEDAKIGFRGQEKGCLGILKKAYTAICVAIAAAADGDEKRYAKVCSALKLLAGHSNQMYPYFYGATSSQTYTVDVFRNLLLCTRLGKSSAVKNLGLTAMDSWLGCVSLGMDKDSPTFSVLVTEFEKLFAAGSDQSDVASSAIDHVSDQLVAIQGFGALAPLIEDDATLQRWFVMSGAYVESAFLAPRDSEANQAAMKYLPEIVTAFADIILHLRNASMLLMRPSSDIVDKIFNTLFQNYSNVHSTVLYRYERSFFYLLYSLDRGSSERGNVLDPMLQRTIKGAIVTSIQPCYSDNNKTYSLPGMLPSGMQIPQPCVVYSCIWKNFLSSDHTLWLKKRGIRDLPSAVVERIAGAVYNQMFQSIIDFLDVLDLSLAVPNDDDEDAADNSMIGDANTDALAPMFVAHASGMTGREKPANQMDFDMFLNLVLFYQRVATSKFKADYFKPCYYEMCKSLVKGATSNPLVSGYFKILAASMRLIERGNFFASLGDDKADGASGDAVMKDGVISVAELCASLLIKFAREVVARSEKVFDDLLISCLEFALTLPSKLRDFDVQIPALQAALKLGVNSPMMAGIALKSLEEWVASDIRQLRRYLPQVLPLLNDFLILPILSDEGSQNGGKLESNDRRNKRAVAQYKRETRRSKFAQSEEEEPTVSTKDIAVRVMKLLGKLGSDSMWLVQGAAESNGSEDFDSSTKILQISMDGGGSTRGAAKGFVLVPVVPRIVHLAEHAWDRKLKLAACEALHALAVLAIGKHNDKVCGSDRRDQDRVDYENLFRFLFPVIIRLAVSIELVAAQLFEPLARQIVHWFTSANRVNMEVEATILLDSVLDCLENSSDGKVREGASKLVSEYVTWTLKGVGSSKEDKKPRQLFLRLYGLMNHPNVNKRIGAYLASKELCNLNGLKNHPDIVDQFLLEFMHNLVLSLQFVECDDPALQTKKSAISALKAFERILTSDRFSAMLKRPRAEGKTMRRLHPDLSDFVHWLFEQIGSHETQCRRYCRDLFVCLCGQLGTNPKGWVADNKQASLRSTFEADLTVQKSPAPTVEVEVSRLKHLVTALDAYEWTLQLNILSPSDVFADASLLSSAIDGFLQLRALTPLRIGETLTPREFARYQNEKSKAIYALIKFVATLIDTYPHDKVAEQEGTKLISGPFLKLIFTSILLPATMELEIVSDPIVVEEIPKQVKRLLEALHSKRMVLAGLARESLQKLLEDKKLDFGSMDMENPPMSSDALILSFSGVKLLKLLPGQLLPASHCSGDLLLHKVWGIVIEGTSTTRGEKAEMSPARKAVLESMLRLSFTLDRDFGRVWGLIFDKGGAAAPEGWEESAGWSFYLDFRDGFLDFLAVSMEERTSSIYPTSQTGFAAFEIASKSPAVAEVLLHLLDSRMTASQQKDDSGNRLSKEVRVTDAVVRMFLDEFSAIESMIQNACKNRNHSTLQRAIDILDKIFRLCAAPGSADIPKTNILSRIVNAVRSCLSDFKDEKQDKIKMDLKNIVAAFKLLPPVLDRAYKDPDAHPEILNNAVKTLMSQSEPDRNDGSYDPNKKQIACFHEVFGALLDAVSRCRTKAIVPVVYDKVILEEDRAMRSQIVEALDVFILGIDEQDAVKLLSEIMAEVVDDAYPAVAGDASHLALLRAKVDKMGLRIVQRLNDDLLVQAFGKYCSKFLEIMEKDVNLDTAAPILTKKIIVMKFLQAFYRRLHYDVVIKERVHPQFSIDEKVNMTLKLVGTLTKARKLDGLSVISKGPSRDGAWWEESEWRADDSARHMIYQFHRTVQNTLAVIMCQTQVDANPDKKKKYYALIFEGTAWENIVDLEHHHRFDVMVNFSKARDALASFRRKQNAMQNRDNVDINQLLYGSMSQSVTATMQTFTSTFSEGSVLRAAQAVVDDGSEIVLEDDGAQGFNTNECMRPFLTLIDHVSEHLGPPSPPPHGDAPEMPKWMEGLRAKLEGGPQQVHVNVRLFIAKIIINHFKLAQQSKGIKRDIFKPFAMKFFDAFFHQKRGLVLIVPAEEHRKVGGGTDEAFNYFLRDICFVWMDWTRDSAAGEFKFETEEQIDMGWNFILLITKIIMHEDQKVVASNVQFFEHFFRQWRLSAKQIHIQSCLEQGIKLLDQFDHLSKKNLDRDKEKRFMRNIKAGLNVIISVSGIELQILKDDARADQQLQLISIVDLRKVFDCLTKVMTTPKAEQTHAAWMKILVATYMAAAQVLSCVRQSREMRTDDLEELCKAMHKQLKDKLDKGMFGPSFSHFGLALDCLQAVVRSFPEFADNDFCWVKVRQYHLKLSGQSLNILQDVIMRKVECIWEIADSEERVKAAQEVVNELRTHFEMMLVKSDAVTQILALRLLTGRFQDGNLGSTANGHGGLLPFLQPEMVKHIFGFRQSSTNTVVSITRIFPMHQNELCRLHFYHLVCDMYESSHLLGLFDEKEMHRLLVPALGDGMEKIRDLALKWWDDFLPKDYGERLNVMLEKMLSPDGDNSNWLCNSTVLLLEMSKRASDYDHALFPRGLRAECEFQEVKISTQVSGGSLPMVPMWTGGGSLGYSSQHGTLGGYSQYGVTYGSTYGGGGGLMATLVGDGGEGMDTDDSAEDFLMAQTQQAGQYFKKRKPKKDDAKGQAKVMTCAPSSSGAFCFVFKALSCAGWQRLSASRALWSVCGARSHGTIWGRVKHQAVLQQE